MAKVLITGSNGFLGSWLAREAAGRGLDTYAAVRKSSDLSLLENVQVHICTIDFEDLEGLEALMSEHRFDYIIHCAGVTRVQKDALYFKVNADYSVSLAKVALKVIGSQLKKFMFISSVEAYGSADETENGYLDNNAEASPRTTYGRSKLRAEKELTAIPSLPLLILRPTAIFGPGEKDLFAVWKTIKQFRFAPVIGNARIKYSFIYVKDLARVILDATLSNITHKSYFVSDGKVYRIKQFTGAIASSLNVRTFGMTIPFVLLDGVVAINKMLDKITGKKSLLNDEQLAKMKARNWDCDISDLVSDFNFIPAYTLENAINESTSWYREKGWL